LLLLLFLKGKIGIFGGAEKRFRDARRSPLINLKRPSKPNELGPFKRSPVDSDSKSGMYIVKCHFHNWAM